MPATFKDGDMTPRTLDAEPRAPVQNVRTTDDGKSSFNCPRHHWSFLQTRVKGFIAGHCCLHKGASSVTRHQASFRVVHSCARIMRFKDVCEHFLPSHFACSLATYRALAASALSGS